MVTTTINERSDAEVTSVRYMRTIVRIWVYDPGIGESATRDFGDRYDVMCLAC